MLKREIIALLARRHKEIRVKDVDKTARIVFDAMCDALVEGRDIEIRGLGSFRVKEYSARQARNPGTGERVELTKRRGVTFRPGLELRRRLNDER